MLLHRFRFIQCIPEYVWLLSTHAHSYLQEVLSFPAVCDSLSPSLLLPIPRLPNRSIPLSNSPIPILMCSDWPLQATLSIPVSVLSGISWTSVGLRKGLQGWFGYALINNPTLATKPASHSLALFWRLQAWCRKVRDLEDPPFPELWFIEKTQPIVMSLSSLNLSHSYSIIICWGIFFKLTAHIILEANKSHWSVSTRSVMGTRAFIFVHPFNKYSVGDF